MVFGERGGGWSVLGRCTLLSIINSEVMNMILVVYFYHRQPWKATPVWFKCLSSADSEGEIFLHSIESRIKWVVINHLYTIYTQV